MSHRDEDLLGRRPELSDCVDRRSVRRGITLTRASRDGSRLGRETDSYGAVRSGRRRGNAAEPVHLV